MVATATAKRIRRQLNRLASVPDGAQRLAQWLPPSAQLESLWEMDTSLGTVISPNHALARMESIPLAYCTSYSVEGCTDARKSTTKMGVLLTPYSTGLNRAD
ncbi:hypothetical protein PWP93_23810 [Paraburkholderia sp. A1RI-2L]|uniref:hypothetical protein n=1 Tax=Paraburkholderia sp. A1RI-2L TaxID=3028367 RepID=UPI003B79AAE9